ncbi:unnamed protein product [Heligmosomoides polygyrus]|uniref:Site-specific DNA-methyltransferase (adenine-specific) n=1 Tax=Heligmosomoides polygyrus TaxID=6339 RepID=A0A183FK71_HELPZ|nr:unnamed protein product [Heligmosomoides polygyrus]
MNKIWDVVWQLDKTINDDEVFYQGLSSRATDNLKTEEDSLRVPLVLEKNIEIWIMLEQAIGNRAGAGHF